MRYIVIMIPKVFLSLCWPFAVMLNSFKYLITETSVPNSHHRVVKSWANKTLGEHWSFFIYVCDLQQRHLPKGVAVHIFWGGGSYFVSYFRLGIFQLTKLRGICFPCISFIHSWTKVLAPLKFWNFKSFRTPSGFIAQSQAMHHLKALIQGFQIWGHTLTSVTKCEQY